MRTLEAMAMLVTCVTTLTACGGDITDSPSTTTSTTSGGTGGAPACSAIEAPTVARRFAESADRGRGVALGPTGELVFTGSFNIASDFGDDVVVAVGNKDAYVMALDPSGVTSWFHSYGSESNSVSGTSVAVSPQGSVVVAGAALYAVDFGGGQRCDSAGADQVFVLGLNAKGEHAYSICFGDDAVIDGPPSVVVDDAGDAIVAVRFTGSMSLGPAPLSAGGAAAVAVAKLNPNGHVLWAKLLGGQTAMMDLGGLAVAGSDIVVTGSLIGTVDFGNGPLKNQKEGTPNTFLVKLDSAGNAVWSKAFASTPSAGGAGVAVGPKGEIALAADGHVSMSFGGPPVSMIGDRDAFLAVFDADGEHLWSKAIGSTKDDGAIGLAWSGDDTITLIMAANDDINPGCGELPINSLSGFVMARFDGQGHPLGAGVYPYLGVEGVVARGGRVALTGSLMAADPLDLGGGKPAGEGGVVVAAWGP